MYFKTLYGMAMLVAVVASPFERPTTSHTSLQRSSGGSIIETPTTYNDTSPLRRQLPSIPVTVYVPDTDPKKDEHTSKIIQAWTDATTLAAFIQTSLWNEEDVFTRYFEKGNDVFVRSTRLVPR